MGARVRWREDRDAWFLYVYHNGTQAAERFGPTLADKRRAERRAKEIGNEIRNARLGMRRREKAVPFDAFARAWVEEKVMLPASRKLEGAVAPKTVAIRDQAVRLHLAPHLGSRDVRSLAVPDVDALESHLIGKQASRKTRNGGQLSRRTIDLVLGTLRVILAHAQAQGIVEANAVDRWKATLPSRGRRRVSAPRNEITERDVLDGSEREALLTAFERSEPHYYALVLFLAETGCRIGEPLTLTWGDFDLTRGEARIYREKTGQVDFVELSDRLRVVLADLEPDISPASVTVFRTPAGNPVRYENFKRRVWDPVVEDVFKSKRRVTPHTLRHTWASLHLSHGTPLEWICRMGGWASSQMLLDVYSHFLPREMRGFSNALSASDRTTPNHVACDPIADQAGAR